MKAVFLDRDGTVTVGVPTYQRVDSVDKVELLPNTFEALSLLASLDYGVFFVTNQAGIAEGLISEEGFHDINNRVLELVAPSGIKILHTYYCPHGENSTCDCRKPKPKMLLDAARDYTVDLAGSWTVGDRPTDVNTGINAGTKTILVLTGEVINPDAHNADYTARDLLEAVRYIASH
jgi:D-glycero-D-manno-heptose 1,7-bisphosphate phosphatase